MILIDGKFKIPDLEVAQETFVQGDASIMSIAAASILAKNFRDREMHELHNQYPGYDFAKHKGYGTKKHIETLQMLGATDVHRKTFLKKIIEI